jgi:hypothetical protein
MCLFNDALCSSIHLDGLGMAANGALWPEIVTLDLVNSKQVCAHMQHTTQTSLLSLFRCELKGAASLPLQCRGYQHTGQNNVWV